MTTRQLTARQLATPALLREDQRTDQQQRILADSVQLHPDIASATSLGQALASFLRERNPTQLDHWIQQVLDSGLQALTAFVTGLHCDYAAVRAALTYEWSNRQFQGQVNRLKFIKRQMYGRASFDLLWLRVLHP